MALLFLVAIAAPGAAQLARVEERRPFTENRPLAAFPGVRPTLASIQGFPQSFGRWYEDHFGLRRALIRWHNRVKAALGVSGVPRVMLGKQGWLFLDRDAEVIEQYRGLRSLDVHALALWRRGIAARRAWLMARGIPYLLVVVPEKHTIYPEQLPDRVTRVRSTTPLDEWLVHLRRTGETAVLDLRPALFAEKGRNAPLYQRTDTHWSGLGAFLGYRAIIAALADRHGLPLAPRDLAAFGLVVREGPGGDLARMLALEDVYRERRVVLVAREPRRARRVAARVRAGRGSAAVYEPMLVYETGDIRLPRALLFGDSFADALIPFLSEHFSRVVYVARPDFRTDLIERERPDVVIHEMAERMLIAPPHEEPSLARNRGEPQRRATREAD